MWYINDVNKAKVMEIKGLCKKTARERERERKRIKMELK